MNERAVRLLLSVDGLSCLAFGACESKDAESRWASADNELAANRGDSKRSRTL